MKKSGKLESWDEKVLAISKRAGESAIQADGNATIWDFWSFLQESLVDYQHWFTATRDPKEILLPFAMNISKGDFIRNISKGTIVRVLRTKAIQDFSQGSFGCIATLSEEISEWDQIKFEDKNNYVRLLPAKGRIENNVFFLNNDIFEEVSPAFVDTITYQLLKRERGGKGQPFSGEKQVRPSPRQFSALDNSKRFVAMEKGIYYDNMVQFDCWNLKDERVDEMICWFEMFMERYTWVWMYNGIKSIIFQQQGMDNRTTSNTKLAQRTVRYFVRTERITRDVTRTFEDITINL